MRYYIFREKDGVWAALAWLQILASKVSSNLIRNIIRSKRNNKKKIFIGLTYARFFMAANNCREFFF